MHFKECLSDTSSPSSTVKGSASLWISWDVLAVMGQHPCGFHGMFWQSAVSTLQGPRGQHWQSRVSIPLDFMGCFGSHGSASLWISWDVLTVRGQHNTGAQGAALAVKGKHPAWIQGTAQPVKEQHPYEGYRTLTLHNYFKARL